MTGEGLHPAEGQVSSMAATSNRIDGPDRQH
jgi:hypothetical protein